MAIVGCIDLETTGLSIQDDAIIEIGIATWCTQRKLPIQIFSQLVKPMSKKVSPEIEALTGISQQDLDLYGVSFAEAMQGAMKLLVTCDSYLAHNGALFDRPMLEAKCSAINLDIPEKIWIDSSTDIPYPEKITVRKLTYLASEHGFLNPFAHRAVFDCLTTLNVMSRYDYEIILALAKEPVITVQAMCKEPWTDNKASTNEAKANGFRWQGDLKIWSKNLKQSQLESEQAKPTLYQVRQLSASS